MGRDKATLRLPGSDETLLARAARHLQAAGAHRIVVATGTVGRLGPLPWDEVGDGRHGGDGPLAGLAAGLQALLGDHDDDGRHDPPIALVLAVDLPFASPPVLAWLAHELEVTGVAGLIPVDPDEGRPQPLHAAYRPDRVAGPVLEALRAGERRVLRVLAGAGAVQVDLPPEVAAPAGPRWARNANAPLDVRLE